MNHVPSQLLYWNDLIEVLCIHHPVLITFVSNLVKYLSYFLRKYIHFLPSLKFFIQLYVYLTCRKFLLHIASLYFFNYLCPWNINTNTPSYSATKFNITIMIWSTFSSIFISKILSIFNMVVGWYHKATYKAFMLFLQDNLILLLEHVANLCWNYQPSQGTLAVVIMDSGIQETSFNFQ